MYLKVSKNINFKSESFREVLPLGPPFRTWKYKGFSKSIKEKYSEYVFNFFYFKTIFLTKSEQRVQLLWSRRFFRHQDRRNRLMSYIDVICAYDIKWRIWHQMTHTTSIYDISQFCRSWCLKKRLDHSNRTRCSDFVKKIVLKFNNWKTCSEYFSFVEL